MAEDRFRSVRRRRFVPAIRDMPRLACRLASPLTMITAGCSGAAQSATDPGRVFCDPLAIELATAISHGDAEGVRRLVRGGGNLSARGEKDVTLLQWAIMRRRPAMVKLLIELGVNPAERGFQRMTALHLAAMAKDTSYLATILVAGADPDVLGGRSDAPVLSEALMSGNADAVALLLQHRANPDLIDRQGETPLHVAAEINDYAGMLMLLRAGADPTIRNNSGKTFLAYLAIHPRDSMMSSEARAARQSVRRWLDEHGYASNVR